MTPTKHYIIYDADAFAQWMQSQWKSDPPLTLTLREEMLLSSCTTSDKVVQDPCTKEPITLHNIISAQQPCVLQYLRQKLGPGSTENIGMIHDPHYFISFFTQHLNELNEELNNIIKN